MVGVFSQGMDPTLIHYDNQRCIKPYENPLFHDTSEHMYLGYCHLRNCMQRRIIMLWYIPIEEWDANILTKASLRGKFEFHMRGIRVVQNHFLATREC